MHRLLLILPTTGYRAEAFVDAASRLDAAITVASEEASSLAAFNPDGLVAIDFNDVTEAIRVVRPIHQRAPFDSVIGVDDASVVLAAAIAEGLSLPSNSSAAVAAARDKVQTRHMLRNAGVVGPRFAPFDIDENPEYLRPDFPFPWVVKPTMLSGSRGVIRANSRREFVLAFQRVGALLRDEAAVAPLDELMAAGSSNRCVLVEEFVPGPEMALEGILVDGRLEVLALFDKPDPLDGPFFEETIYVTPSSLSENVRGRASAAVASAAAALGLHDGPIHAEVRLGWSQPVVIEINPRSIGGRCSRILRFGSGMSLEELLLRHALQLPIPSPRLETGAAGVLMIPTPGEGEILGIEGVAAALEVPGITEIDITAHRGQFIRPLPEGSGYLGFVFARAETQEAVISAIEKAHGKLRFRLSSTAAAPRAA